MCAKMLVLGIDLEENVKCSAKYYAVYLGLGMTYEAGICTIVISMNGAFK